MMKLSPSLYDWLTALAATVIGLLLSFAVIRGVVSFVDFLNDDSGEFEYTDIYERVAQRRSLATLSDEIVVVSVDGCSRKRIADVIDAVGFMSPAAVGLDLFFTYPSEEGFDLVESIKGCGNIVLPVAVGREDSESFFYGDFAADYAAVNMISSSSFDIIRDYSTLFRSDTAVVPSMAYSLVEKAGYDIPAPDSRLRPIWYPSVEFDVIHADEIVDSDGFPCMEIAGSLEGKIVLIGVTEDPSDVHRTPIEEQMSGVMIHAHIADTIINDRYVKEVVEFWNYLIAFVVCLLFLRLTIYMKNLWDDVGEMVMSVAQVLLIYVFLVLGANLYIKHMFFIDFSMTMVAIGLSITVLTLIKGMIYLYLKYSKK